MNRVEMARDHAARLIRFVLACSVAWLWPVIAAADDSSTGVMLPAPRAEPPASVSVRAAHVRLDAGRIVVDRTLAVEGEGARLAIDTPRFGWLGEGETYPDRQFPELAISLDGHQAKIDDGFRAFANGADISALLREAGLDPFVIAKTPPLLPKGSATGQLARMGAVGPSEDGTLARWTAERSIRMALPAASASLLTLTYLGRPAYGLVDAAHTDRLGLPQVCMDQRQFRDAIGPSLASHPYVFARYEIPVAIGASLPRVVTLGVGAADAQEHKRVLVAFCANTGMPTMLRGARDGLAARPGASGVLTILSVSDESLAP